jgi:hypothetical protein
LVLTRVLGNWDGAYADFFSSFKSYAESGSHHKIRVLKYLILTAMLMRSTIDPLDSQEARPYRNDPDIVAMTNMVKAYESEDILAYEQNLRHHKELMEDPFVAGNISDVTRNIRMKAITTYIVPYSEFTLDALCKQLYIPRADLAELIVFMALNDGLRAQINESTGHVVINRAGEPDTSAVQAWTDAMRQNLNHLLDESSMGYPIRQPADAKKKKKDKAGKDGGKKRDDGKDDGDDDDEGGKGGKKKTPNSNVAVPARLKAQGSAKGTAGRKVAAPAASATPIRPHKPSRPPRSAATVKISPYSSCFSSSPATGDSSSSGSCQLLPRAPSSPLCRPQDKEITGAADGLAVPLPFPLA